MKVPLRDSSCRIDEIIGLEALESVRPLWEKWQIHPNADIDFFITIAKSRQNVVNPLVLVMYKNDTPVALAACRLEKAALPITFGYLKISRSEIMQLTIVYGGLMGAWDESLAVSFISQLRPLMRKMHIDAAYLAAMRLDNVVYLAAKRFVPFFLRDSLQKANLHWWADLPETFDLFQKKISTKHRSQFRNRERKLSQHRGAELEVKIFQTPEEVSLFCAIGEEIARSTYLRGIGEGFYDNEEMRKRLELASRKGWMRGYVLSANQKPLAFWLGSLYNNVFYLDYTGFDPDLKDFAPGQILFIKMIEILCSAGSIRGIDFGFGDAEYKQRYGDRSWEEADLYLFNNTTGMFLKNLTRKSAALARIVAEKAFHRTGLIARIKKRWRLKAQKAASKNETIK